MIARASEEAEKDPGSALVLPMSVAELLEIRAQIIEAWKEANRAIDGIEQAFARIHDKDFTFHHESGGQRFEKRQDPIDIPAMTADLDYSLYVFALHKLNITQAMTEKSRDEFLEKIKKQRTPFEEKQLLGLAQNAGQLFRESRLNTVREVYRRLIGVGYAGGNWGSGKKDNLQKVEKVFRVGYSDLGIASFTGKIENSSWRVSAFSGFLFNDLLTACRLIEGEGFTDYSNNIDALCRAVTHGQKWVDTGYFKVTAYHIGNVKVNWNEDKIHVLEKLNAIGSGRENAMPDVQRKRYKAEHFHNNGMPDAVDFFRPDPNAKPNDNKDFALNPARRAVACDSLHGIHTINLNGVSKKITIFNSCPVQDSIAVTIPDSMICHKDPCKEAAEKPIPKPKVYWGALRDSGIQKEADSVFVFVQLDQGNSHMLSKAESEALDRELDSLEIVHPNCKRPTCFYDPGFAESLGKWTASKKSKGVAQ